MKENIINLKIRSFCNEKNEKQPPEYTVSIQDKEENRDIEFTTTDLVYALSAILNRLN